MLMTDEVPSRFPIDIALTFNRHGASRREKGIIVRLPNRIARGCIRAGTIVVDVILASWPL